VLTGLFSRAGCSQGHTRAFNLGVYKSPLPLLEPCGIREEKAALFFLEGLLFPPGEKRGAGAKTLGSTSQMWGPPRELRARADGWSTGVTPPRGGERHTYFSLGGAAPLLFVSPPPTSSFSLFRRLPARL